MPLFRFRNLVIALLVICSTSVLALGAEPTASLKKGTPDLKSAGALALVLTESSSWGMPAERPFLRSIRPIEPRPPQGMRYRSKTLWEKSRPC